MIDEIAIACKGFKICRHQVRAVLNALRRHAAWEFPAGTLSIAFVDDEKMCELHAQFLNDPTKTDVITFPGDVVFDVPVRREIPARRHAQNSKKNQEARRKPAENGTFAGEIVICVDQARRAAKEFGTTFEAEILLYLVHGWLHLAGLNDLVPAERAQMRAAEAEALAFLEKTTEAKFSNSPAKTLKRAGKSS